MKVPAGSLTTYTWDYENQLSKVLLSSGTRNTSSYDADGKRVRKDDSTGTSKFLWDAENILLETNVSDVTQVVYSQEPAGYGNLFSQYRGGSTSFFHFDGLGSADRLSNNTPSVTDSFIYETFGRVRSSSGSTANNFKYVGKLGYYWDSDLAVYLLRARYYDPATGRFLSRDPLFFRFDHWMLSTLSPISASSMHGNQFAYVHNRPSIAIDPSGHQGTIAGELIIVLVGMLILGVLAYFLVTMPKPKPKPWTWSWPTTKPATQPKPQPEPKIDPVPPLGPLAKQRWKGSCKARGSCPPGCGIFPAEGSSKAECEAIAWNACVAAGCNTPGGSPHNCLCGHAFCFSIS